MRIKILITAMLLNLCRSAPAQIDSLFTVLDTVAITGKRAELDLKGNSARTLKWDMKMMHEMPKILGNADPMHYTQLLPGIQTCSEYDSGLHIQGCDNAHNHVGIDGVPVYNASHLFGLFSVFNASHFGEMQVAKNAFSATSPNRLGGVLDMLTFVDAPQRLCGEITAGPMSSQGTLRIPVGRNSSLALSARSAYLNLLYGPFLKIDDSQIKYGFSDYNMTFSSRLKQDVQMCFNLYMGSDDVAIEDGTNGEGMKLDWGNILASLSLKHKTSEASAIKHTVFYTGYSNRFSWDIMGNSIRLPSHIRTAGYKGEWKSTYFTAGLEGTFYSIKPQTPVYKADSPANTKTKSVFDMQEYSLFMDYTHGWGNWILSAGVRGSYYRGEETDEYMALDPSVTIEYNISGNSRAALNYGWRHQYLHKTGFSETGLPTEFWLHSDRKRKPQYSQSIGAYYETGFLDNNYSLTFEVYYKRLYNQIEYKGNVLDFINEKYDLDKQLLKGDGRNFGINVMLNKLTGRLTGWMSYSLGRALRRFDNPGFNDTYPASHERIHELNMAATYTLNEKWSFGGTFVVASGTPFTAPKHIYLAGGQIVSEYGEHNANRLDPYIRGDISANYYFSKKKGKESGINLSIYNATTVKNNIFVRLKVYNNRFRYKPVYFLMRVMPSISYFYKF